MRGERGVLWDRAFHLWQLMLPPGSSVRTELNYRAPSLGCGKPPTRTPTHILGDQKRSVRHTGGVVFLGRAPIGRMGVTDGGPGRLRRQTGRQDRCFVGGLLVRKRLREAWLRRLAPPTATCTETDR